LAAAASHPEASVVAAAAAAAVVAVVVAGAVVTAAPQLDKLEETVVVLMRGPAPGLERLERAEAIVMGRWPAARLKDVVQPLL
jgi:hypothetical protein